MIVNIKQIIDIPHPMYVTIESAVDSAAGACNRNGHVSLQLFGQYQHRISNITTCNMVSSIAIYALSSGLTFPTFTKTAKLVK